MNVSRWYNLVIRGTMLGALVGGTASIAVAQKPVGPPSVTKGTVKSNPNANKGQSQAEAARAAARERKETKSAFKAARDEHKALLKGIKFTSAEKRVHRSVSKRFNGQFDALEKADNAAHRAGRPDASIISKIDALRLEERAQLRAAMAPAQRARFDMNISRLRI